MLDGYAHDLNRYLSTDDPLPCRECGGVDFEDCPVCEGTGVRDEDDAREEEDPRGD